MYLLDLEMSNIKSEALPQERSKKSIIKNYPEFIRKQLCV